MSVSGVPDDADTYVLRQEIDKREKLLKQMVGSLYPPIVQGEIDELKDRLKTARPGTVLCGLRRFRRPFTSLSFLVPRHATPGFQDEIPQKFDDTLKSSGMMQKDLFYIQSGSRRYLAEWAFVVPLGPIYEILQIL